MRKNDDYLIEGSIEPVWLETPLKAESTSPQSADAKPRGVRWWWLVLLCVTIAVGIFVWRVSTPDASDWMQTGWQAYQAGHYEVAQQAISEAREADPTLEGLERLTQAVAVAPALDAAQKLAQQGRPDDARALLEKALQQAPDDPRALRMALALRKAPASRPAVVLTPRTPSIASVDPAPSARTAPKTNAPPSPASDVPVAKVPPSSVPEVPVAKAPPSTAPTSLAVRRPPRRTRTRRSRMGTVRVVSNAPSLVVVDNVLSSQRTPATLRLTPGTHAVQLRDASSGAVLGRQEVYVRARQAQTLRFSVTPPRIAAAVPASTAAARTMASPTRAVPASAAPSTDPPAAPVTAPPTVAPAPAPAPSTAPKPPAVPRGPAGFLSVTSSRPAQVIIDGRATGLTTPLWMHKIPAGRHRVALRDATGTFGARSVVIKPKQMVPIVIRKGTPQ